MLNGHKIAQLLTVAMMSMRELGKNAIWCTGSMSSTVRCDDGIAWADDTVASLDI